MCFISMSEDLLCREQAIECSGKARINSHLHDNFDDFFSRGPDVEGSMDVHFELRCARSWTKWTPSARRSQAQACSGADFPRTTSGIDTFHALDGVTCATYLLGSHSLIEQFQVRSC